MAVGPIFLTVTARGSSATREGGHSARRREGSGGGGGGTQQRLCLGLGADPGFGHGGCQGAVGEVNEALA